MDGNLVGIVAGGGFTEVTEMMGEGKALCMRRYRSFTIMFRASDTKKEHFGCSASSPPGAFRPFEPFHPPLPTLKHQDTGGCDKSVSIPDRARHTASLGFIESKSRTSSARMSYVLLES